MSLRHLSTEIEKNSLYLSLFQTGNERGLTYFYQHSYPSLFWIGKELIKDEFLITCILHECYLKAWQHRERMESLPHIYRFIRMNLCWQILRHIEKSRHSIYGKTVLIDHFETTMGDFEDVLTDKESYENDSANFERITRALKYLSSDAQQIAALHFKQGLTHKQIADRLGTSTIQVSNQIKKSLEQIKDMVHSQSKSKRENLPAKKLNPDTESLNAQQTYIYQLRKIQKMSFADIALKLEMNQVQVQQQYIQAHQLLKNQNSQQKVNRF